MPGSPPTRITLPLTNPPPRIRSSSAKPLCERGARSVCTAPSFWRTPPLEALTTPDWDFRAAPGCSTRLLHSPQVGHLPNHFGDDAPHSRQKKTLFVLLAVTKTQRPATSVGQTHCLNQVPPRETGLLDSRALPWETAMRTVPSRKIRPLSLGHLHCGSRPLR